MEVVAPPRQHEMAGEGDSLLPSRLGKDLQIGGEDTPAYNALKQAGLLCTRFRRNSVEDIFTGADLRANSSQQNDIQEKLKNCYYCGGCCIYSCTHVEIFVKAGHVGLLMNSRNDYLFAQPGMHNIRSCFVRVVGAPVALRGHIRHGNRTIVIVEQGFIGYANDNGQPVLLPPGIHVWTSDSMDYIREVHLRDHIIHLGPYTLITCDEGYAAVTQNNGKQMVLEGGHTHLLDHMNWKFEKFITLKIQTDDLERIQATSADNINMLVTSTVNWRIVDAVIAATMAAETMATSGKAGDVSADLGKMRKDVLKQALASLAGFIGSVNYSESFHMSAAVQSQKHALSHDGPVHRTSGVGLEPSAEPLPDKGFADNPLYDTAKMMSAVEHANRVTRTYGVEVLSINIISAAPCDHALTSSLAAGAVASAKALQEETQARGTANATRISAEARAEQIRIETSGKADSQIIAARSAAESKEIMAQSDKASEILRAEGTAESMRLHATATSDGLKDVAQAIEAKGGQSAMVQRLAEQYVTYLPEMVKASALMIVPDRPNDVTGVLNTALSLTSKKVSRRRASELMEETEIVDC